ncbi:discoidin domain-containing protein [Luteolibacter arcticus]|uniref:Discoidin domain-containing protein n=1 Tax=Luteolibacter arcticus TaxID=1581411 RepID=A0ABT3GP55_9BACT|nr:discoidin domain-containing protein [Luteolibacter arcticus]MCW1925297.1 discoidin domain-containing protein [Luteolibacter arcticus]
MTKENYTNAQERFACPAARGMVAAMECRIPSSLVAAAFAAISLASAVAQSPNLAVGAEATSSSVRPLNPASYAIDGVVDDRSRWLASETDKQPSIEIRFARPVSIGAIDVYTGWEDQPGLAGFDVSFETDGRWQHPETGKVRGNIDPAKRLLVSLNRVTALKLVVPEKSPARLREIAVYADAKTAMGVGLTGERLGTRAVDRGVHQIALNEVGFETARTKRFTAPLSPDGSRFVVRAADGGDPLYQAEIRGNVGDFSVFKPAGSATEYVIEVRGGSLRSGTSDRFLIQPDLYQDLFWQPAVDFLIDSRSVVGTHPSAYGGCPWRDGTNYDAIVPSLVLLHRAAPARIEAMPRQMDWDADKRRVLDAAFKFDAKNPCSEGVMDAVRKYFTELEPPKPDAPDVVKLIHWGAGYYLVNPATKDPSGDPDPRQIHPQTVEQVAYVVWAWPQLEKWLPRTFYEKCRTFCVENWSRSLEIPKWWNPETYLTPEQLVGDNPHAGLLHPYKGRHAPGHSIVPNLLMHEIAKRDKLPEPDRYLDAAVKQAEWIVKKLDWNDPRTTKGHRMSEHRTIPNLVWLLQRYPNHAPAGLKEKITAWAEVAAKRSDNLWDFRRFDDGKHWTIPKLNDVGNWLGTPAIALSASWVIDDPRLKARMQELAVTHADAVFGRNPRLAAAPQLLDGFTGIDRPWPKKFPNNHCARLELCRGSISSGPGSEMYPFNPEGSYRHAEGWVNYGATWCISLAYLEFDRTNSKP